MAKKKSSPQPVTAEEPARPEEQLRFEETSAPASSRKSSGGSSGGGSSSRSDSKIYGARSARERRAARGGSSGSARRARRGSTGRVNNAVVEQMLEHPTINVGENELRKEYSYVVTDLRSMGILAAVLIATLVVLAQVLPKALL